MSLSLESINQKIASLNLQVEGYSALSEADKLASQLEASMPIEAAGEAQKLKDAIKSGDFEKSKDAMVSIARKARELASKVLSKAAPDKKKLVDHALKAINGVIKDIEVSDSALKNFLNDKKKLPAFLQVIEMMLNPGSMIQGLESRFFKLVEKATGGKLVPVGIKEDPAKYAALQLLDEVSKAASEQGLKVASDVTAAYYDLLASFMEGEV